MESAGQCGVCGNVGTSLYTCSICGKRVCRSCFMAKGSMCVSCSGGRRFTPVKMRRRI